MTRTVRSLLAGLVVLVGAPGAVSAQPAGALAPNDYADKASWLCRPGATPNACQADLTTTVVRADGSTSREGFVPDPGAPIDCFYVYPTVSRDPGVLSTLKVAAEEREVAVQQFARFGASCRLFAPMYRQFTLAALFAAMTGHPMTSSAERPLTPYLDVRDAWRYYLLHDNHGRGVVLIGHSQGSIVLTELIKREIDGKPDQARLVSAILMGTSLAVPAGADLGGDFKSIPLCHAPAQLGCVIAYASFREASPPPENSRFGRPRTPAPGLVAACVNPASLAGGPGALHSYFASGPVNPDADARPQRPWLAGKAIGTPFVSVPGLLTAACVSTPMFNYLAVHVNADQPGPRAHDIPGDIVVGGMVQKDWGLHLIDASLAMGNLVEVVRAEGRAWAAAHP